MIITRCDVCGNTLVGAEEEMASFYGIEIEAEFIDVDDDKRGGWGMNHQFHICPRCYELAKANSYAQHVEHSKAKLLTMVKALIEAGILTHQEEKNSKTE